NEELEQSFKKCQADFIEMQAQLSNMERYSRCRNLVIKGIPSTENEQTNNIVTKILVHLGIDATNLVESHRLNSSKPHSNILAVMKSHSVKKDTLNNYFKKRTLTIGTVFDEPNADPEKRIYLFEHLTPSDQKLLFRMRANMHQLGYEQCFSSEGCVYIK